MTDIPSRFTAALADRYSVERRLGEGGMATVYLAQDLKHRRKVAIKVLKPELAAVVGADRFLAEIETTAQLQHPHILPLFDSGEADSFLYYVMPYVEGETLRDRLDRERQFPVDEAVALAVKVASALAYAHENGVLHRDIKPANILLSRGEPLVADFGIALALGAAGGGRLTETGLSLGTPYYMSPEQATGDQYVAQPSDIYALGCVLYEMLVGEPPYGGSTAQAVLGKIIAGDPVAPTTARASIPTNVDAAIRKALERLPADRFSAAEDFGRALNDPGFRYGEPAGAGAAGSPGPWKPLTVGAGVVAVAALGLAGWALSRDGQAGAVPLNVMLDLPADQGFVGYGSFDLSPDGSFMVYQGPGDRGGQLWIRRFSELDAEPIPGTTDGVLPDISPDGTEVVYQNTGFPVRQLFVASLTGGGVRRVADSAWCCAYWGDDGQLYYVTPAKQDGPARTLYRTDPDGLAREPLFSIPDGRNIWAPAIFRGGTRALQSAATGNSGYILGVNLETGDTVRVGPGLEPTVTTAGTLLYVNADWELMAAAFDEDAMEITAPPLLLASGLLDTGDDIGHFAVSSDGDMLVYRRRPSNQTEMTPHWLDGVRPEVIDPEWRVDFPSQVGGVALSPSGDRLATSVVIDGQVDVVVKQLPTGAAIRLSLSDATDGRPSWTPDGRFVTFLSDRAGPAAVYRRRADGAGTTELVYEDPAGIEEAAWSPDGEWLVYRTDRFSAGGGNIMGIRPGVDSVPVPLVAGDFEEVHPTVSPDGRWLAYASAESGRFEVFVVPFPDTDERRIPISSRGGTAPRWSPDGRSLFYVAGGEHSTGGLIRAELQLEPPYSHRETPVSIAGTVDTWGRSEAVQYDVHPGTGRVIGLLREGGQVETQLVLVQGLTERIRAARRGGG